MYLSYRRTLKKDGEISNAEGKRNCVDSGKFAGRLSIFQCTGRFPLSFFNLL